MYVFPISISQVNWRTWLELSSKLLGRNLSIPLDAKGIKVGDLASFVSALGLFHTFDSDPVQTQREAGSLLKHCMISIMIACDRDLIYEIISHGKLAMLDSENPKLFILSASLEDWRATIINFASPLVSKDGRIFASLILKEFDTLGLTRIFENYSRRYKDTELVLIQK